MSSTASGLMAEITLFHGTASPLSDTPSPVKVICFFCTTAGRLLLWRRPVIQLHGDKVFG